MTREISSVVSPRRSEAIRARKGPGWRHGVYGHCHTWGRRGTTLPTRHPREAGPRVQQDKLRGVGQEWPSARTWGNNRPGSGPNMVSVAGGRTVTCSGPKVAALIVGTLLFLTGIGVASWAIGKSG